MPNKRAKAVISELMGKTLDSDVVVRSWKPPQDEAAVESMLHWRGSPNRARLRAMLFPAVSVQPKNLVELLRHPGMQELLDPISWTIRTLARRNRGFRRRTTAVKVRRVMCHIWMPARVARIFEKMAEGTKPPPVSLSRVRYKEEEFYIVDDGHHRCESAKMRREESVRATIIEGRHFVPGDWRITETGFRHVRTGRIVKAAADLRAAARWLGVKPTRLPKAGFQLKKDRSGRDNY